MTDRHARSRPTEDILHVRLQTIGVTEHQFDINLGGSNYNWLLYDVGGAVRLGFQFLVSQWSAI